jgi:hypothetical protein
VRGRQQRHGSLDVPLLSHCFNGIACGRSDGQHHAGGTIAGIDKQGRMKPEIVAPAGATSFSTPLVSGACALLVEAARTAPNTAADPNAQRPEVIKAALLAGANHRSGWTNNPATTGATRGSTLTPIDPLWGCDQGRRQQEPLDPHRRRASQRCRGGVGDLGRAARLGGRATTAATSRYWRFQVERAKDHVSVLATWNRQTSANFGAYTIPDLDLEMWSVDSSNNLITLVGTSAGTYFGDGNVASASAKDNLEHLFVRDLQPGDYVLELRRTADALGSWNVAVAWEFACEAPVAYGTGKITSLGQEARIAARGIPSEAANDFHLTISNALPNTNGIVFYGSAQASTPFQGGTKWVASPIVRMGLVQCDASGALDVPVAIDASMPGTTRYYQFWFRDPQQADGTSVGLTNGIAVGFCR